ncbi:MAG: Maf family protein [Lachnospiraceae bacterium]|nr:Maf family protein [Lachnospiraceae bacterium]
MPKIILASGSPRRRELLTQIGISFEVLPAKGEELTDQIFPPDVVSQLSLQKATEIASLPRFIGTEQIILGADTIVALDAQIMGKPKDEPDAFRMLKALQGRTHQVYTGVTLIRTQKEPQILTFTELTEVTMYPMSDTEILAYIATGDPLDKAGAYGIQGACAAFIEKINGDYNNVVGLPAAHVYQVLKEFI